MDTQPHTLADYFTIFKRRRWEIIGTSLSLFLLSIILALSLPPVYRSTATILIEEQEVPPDLVRSTITSYVDQQIQTIKHHVMSRPNLMNIIDRYALYPEMRLTKTTEEVIERLTNDIQIEVISADVIDKRTNHPTQAHHRLYTVLRWTNTPSSSESRQ